MFKNAQFPNQPSCQTKWHSDSAFLCCDYNFNLKFWKSITRPLVIDFAKCYWIWTNIRAPWNDLIITLMFSSCKNALHTLPIIIHTQTFTGRNSVQNYINIHIKHFENCLKIFLAPFWANIRLSAFFIRNIPSQT